MTTKVAMIICAMGLGVATMAGCSSKDKQVEETAPVALSETYTPPTIVQSEQPQSQQIASLGASSSGLSH